MENMPETKKNAFDLQHYLVQLKRLAKHVWKHFKEDRCFEEAASLGYTSLLAMVPLLAVIFGIIAVFPVFSDWSEQLKSFVFDNFLPATGEQVEGYLNTFLDSASSLTLPGTVFLILTALLLMFRIEVAFNRIWRVDRSRTLMNRIVMYWAVLTLGPMMIGAAIALSVQNIIAPLSLEQAVTPASHEAGIFLLSWMAFAVMFTLVPNRRIPIRDAIIGALFSAVLFELAKLGFVAYVRNANYAVIYGALATIPLFLFWLYLVWIVILFGASLASSLTTFADSERARENWPARFDFLMVFRLVGHLWQAQRRGEKLSFSQLLAQETHTSHSQLQYLIRQLESAHIVVRDEDGDLRLVRDLEELTLTDLYCSGHYHLPMVESESLPVESDWDRSFEQAMKNVLTHGLSQLNQPLRHMYLQKRNSASDQ
jgi:membrane protein